ncbi:MAG: GntR family transcriptional regulator [Hyphomicrobium sp.]
MKQQEPSPRKAPSPVPSGIAPGLGLTTHESVYRQLRDRILCGGFAPGEAVTLRGIADELGVSPMPIRDAVRRLIAERALEMRDNRRVLVPPMTRTKFTQILFARKALEPELAGLALSRLTPKAISKIEAIDDGLGRSVSAGDPQGYMRGNYQFHFTLYERAAAEMLLALVASVWLQFGPFMRMAYGRLGTSDLTDFHEVAISAMKDRNETALRRAITDDIEQGMGYIGDTVLGRRQ